MHRDAATLPCACTALRKASRAISRAYDAALAPTGLTSAQYAILRRVQRAGPLPLSRLAEWLVMDRTSLYRALAPMERAGWLTLASGAGRAKVATLTAAGDDLIERAVPHWEGAQRRVVDTFGADRWAELQASIAALTDAGVAAGRHGAGT